MIIHPSKLCPDMLGRPITIVHDEAITTGVLTKLCVNVTYTTSQRMGDRTRVWNDSYVVINSTRVNLGESDAITLLEGN